MRFIFLYHLGLGDHIIINGLLHRFLKQTPNVEELCIIAMDDYRKKTIEHLYSDFPIVTFYSIPAETIEKDNIFLQIHKKPIGTVVTLHAKEYYCINFGLHSERGQIVSTDEFSWVDYLYNYPLSFDSNIRYQEFHCPTSMSTAKSKYEELLRTIGTSGYILLHDEPKRGRSFKPDRIKEILEKDFMIDLPVIYLGKDRYLQPLIEGLNTAHVGNLLESDSLLDLLYILQGASACHLMDSSVACLADVSNIQCKLYMHSYIVANSGKQFKRKPWVRIEN